MTRTTHWKKRLGLIMTPLFAVTATVATSQDQVGADNSNSNDDNDTVRSANGEPTFELCAPDYGGGKSLHTMTVEGFDGQPITNLTDVTFEITSADGSSLNVTEYVEPADILLNFYSDDLFTDDNSPFRNFFDVPINSYFDPISAPHILILGCSSLRIDRSNYVQVCDHISDQCGTDVITQEPFPAGSTLVAKRNGATIATADISGRQQVDWSDMPIFSALESFLTETLFTENNCLPPTPIFGPNATGTDTNGIMTLTDLERCTLFSDVYNELIGLTGQRLHPSFAHFAIALPGLALQLYRYSEDDFFNDFFGIGNTSSANVRAHSLTHSLPSIASMMNRMQNMSSAMSSEEITAQYIDFTQCDATLLSTVAVIREPEFEFDDSDNREMTVPPVFRMSAGGRGLAQSLSDPRINEWPELDDCLATLYLTPLNGQPEEENNEECDGFCGFGPGVGLLDFIRALPALITLEAFVLQTLVHDVPLGLAPASVAGGAMSLPIQLQAVSRIPWQWTDDTLAAIKVGQPYADGVAATGTPMPTYSVTSGALPTGLSLDPTTGAITGTPTKQGAFSFAITATNSVGALTKSFTLGTTVTARPKLRANRANKLVTFNGRVPASFTGKRVLFQQRVNGKWKTMERLEISSNRRVTTSVFTRQVKRYRIVAGINPSLPIRK